MPRLARFVRLREGTGRPLGPILLLVALAALVRQGLVLASPGGIRGSYGYDASVYYAAADALLHGRVPYRDFWFLHPPAIMVALTPVAALGQLVGDHAAFLVGNALFTLLGAANAGLVVAVGRRLQLPERAALLGGLFYAVWFGAVEAEVSARLEPLGTALFLTGLLLGAGDEPLSRRRALLAGMALAGAVSVKAWWVVPVVLVLAWWAAQRRRELPQLLLGAVLLGVVLDGPFLVMAPSEMSRMVVTDQLGRHDVGTQGLRRLAHVLSVEQAFPARRGILFVLMSLAALLGLLLLLSAWRVRAARPLLLVLAGQLLLLQLAPSYFSFYSGYPAAALALVVAAAAGGAQRWGQVVAGVAVAAAVTLTAIVVTVHRPAFTKPVPGAATLARGVADVDCLMSDSPMALIELNALSRGLAKGCPNWIDVTGRTYDVDAPPDGGPQGRKDNARWQASLTRYLLSGDAALLFRPETGASAETVRAVSSHPVLVRAGRLSVYRTR